MYVLGLYNGHNATCCLMKDGKIIACASEERFTGKKNYQGFPQKALKYCLEEAGIKVNQVDIMVIPFKYGAPIFSLRTEDIDPYLGTLKSLYRSVGFIIKAWGEVAYRLTKLKFVGQVAYRLTGLVVERIHMGNERRFIANYLGISEDRVVTFDHHLCHAASTYYASPFSGKKALVLTLDGEGDFNCATVNIFEKGKIKTLAKSPREASIGYLYLRLTEHLGMKANEHEYKVMGLAPYAKGPEIDEAYNLIKDIVYLSPKNKLVFDSKFNLVDSGKFIKRELSKYRFDILAAAFQRLVEDRISEWVAYAVNKTKINTVVLSGGVFMNIKANQKVASLPGVKKLFIMPSAGDESTPIGACYLGFLEKGEKSFYKNLSIGPIYWGPQFSEKEIEAAIRKNGIRRKYTVQKIKNIERRMAQLLSQGKVVARLSGRMEFGARALGNRSIFANPKNQEVIREINEQIKGRDFWMPFAPTILWERMGDYLINPKKIHSPYMMLGFDTKEEKRDEIAAGLHQYDLTARPQLLKEEENPSYYKIIKEFEKLTGIGAVLNTSFNLHGLPIVLGPEEALYTFENSGLEYLALGDYLVSKK